MGTLLLVFVLLGCPAPLLLPHIMKSLTILALVGICYAATLSRTDETTTTTTPEPKPYNFGFEVSDDNTTNYQNRVETSDGNGRRPAGGHPPALDQPRGGSPAAAVNASTRATIDRPIDRSIETKREMMCC